MQTLIFTALRCVGIQLPLVGVLKSQSIRGFPALYGALSKAANLTGSPSNVLICTVVTMKSRVSAAAYRSPYLGSAVIASVLSLSGCGSEAPRLDVPDAQIVQTVILGEPELSDVRRFPGRVQAYQTARLAFQVSGPLVELPVTEGQQVAQGDLLASIDPRDYQNELKARQADAAEKLKQFERYAELLKTKSVPEDQYQLQKAHYEMAAARLKQAEKNLDDTHLRAPFSGIVARRYVENFQNVKAKEPIVLLEDVSRLDVVIQVPEQGLASLDPGQLRRGIEVGEVSFENLPERRFPATVKEFQIAADPDSQTYQVTLMLPAPEGVHILPGMTATVVPTGEYAKGMQRLFVVPVTAVLAGPDGSPFVWLLDRSVMTVKRQAVTVGELTGGAIQVVEGLDSGDEVISAGGPYLAEGSKVILASDRREG